MSLKYLVLGASLLMGTGCSVIPKTVGDYAIEENSRDVLRAYAGTMEGQLKDTFSNSLHKFDVDGNKSIALNESLEIIKYVDKRFSEFVTELEEEREK